MPMRGIDGFIRCVCLGFLVISSNIYAEANISVEYKQTDYYQHILNLIRKDGLVEQLSKFVELQIKLRSPITITVGAKDGPLFDLDNSQMLIPYAFIDETIELFLNDGYALEQAETYALDVFEHTLFHELGHGLIDQLQIPFTGKEEDAVDELAALLIIATNKNAGEVILSAADSFRLYDAHIKQFEEQDFSAEHSLDIQRFYNLVCIMYANDPDSYNEVIAQLDLELDTVQRCVDDYPRQVKNWLILLKPHLTSSTRFSKLFKH